jgi:hypothetical protein
VHEVADAREYVLMAIHFPEHPMEASILDLRYRMKDVLRALDRREKVRILYHGKEKGTIIPPGRETRSKIVDHAFFGMIRKDKRSVAEVMDELRGGRHRAL